MAVISQAAARRFWPDRDPVNAVIHLGINAFTGSHRGRLIGFPAELGMTEMRPVIFLPDAQAPARTTSVIIRTRTEPMSLARPIRAAVAQLDDRQPLTEIEPLERNDLGLAVSHPIIERLLLIGAAPHRPSR